MEYRSRNCDLCGGKNLERIRKWTHTSRTRSRIEEWNVSVVVCEDCGFAFTSPTPTDASLASYYQDSFLRVAGETLDYSIEKRLQVIDQFASGRREVFVEIGSNSREFAKRLGKTFSRIDCVEINNESDALRESSGLGNADVVAAYFVLEHVPSIDAFLRECSRIAKDGGIVIIEVPDIAEYPRDPSGLQFFEHVNHFSVGTLTHFAARNELSLLYAGHDLCSRTFGFVAVFRKSENIEMQPAPGESQRAKALLKEGFGRIDAFEKILEKAREKIRSNSTAGLTSVVWVANDISRQLMEKIGNDPYVTVVDLDPSKRRFLEMIEVTEPQNATMAIAGASSIFICSQTHANKIIEWIDKHATPKHSQNISVLRLV